MAESKKNGFNFEPSPDPKPVPALEPVPEEPPKPKKKWPIILCVSIAVILVAVLSVLIINGTHKDENDVLPQYTANGFSIVRSGIYLADETYYAAKESVVSADISAYEKDSAELRKADDTSIPLFGSVPILELAYAQDSDTEGEKAVSLELRQKNKVVASISDTVNRLPKKGAFYPNLGKLFINAAAGDYTLLFLIDGNTALVREITLVNK